MQHVLEYRIIPPWFFFHTNETSNPPKLSGRDRDLDRCERRALEAADLGHGGRPGCRRRVAESGTTAREKGTLDRERYRESVLFAYRGP